MNVHYKPDLSTLDLLAGYTVAAARQTACAEMSAEVVVQRINHLDIGDIDELALRPSHKAMLRYLTSDEVREGAAHLRFQSKGQPEHLMIHRPDGVAGHAAAFLDRRVFDHFGQWEANDPEQYYWNETGEHNYGGANCRYCFMYMTSYPTGEICWPCHPSAAEKNSLIETLDAQIIDLNGPGPLIPFEEILKGEEIRFTVPVLTVADITG